VTYRDSSRDYRERVH